MSIAIVCDNYSPHLSTRVDQRVGDWAAANNVELAGSSGGPQAPVRRRP